MADERFKCVLDYTASVAIAASCGCCVDICHGLGYCMHGDGEVACDECEAWMDAL